MNRETTPSLDVLMAASLYLNALLQKSGARRWRWR